MVQKESLKGSREENSGFVSWQKFAILALIESTKEKATLTTWLFKKSNSAFCKSFDRLTAERNV